MSDRLKGYQLELVDRNLARSEALKCFSCTFLLRDAVQTEDGYRLCRVCFLFILERPDHTCPTSGLELKNNKHHPDIAVRKEIEKVEVKCANHKDGCTWTGPLVVYERKHQYKCMTSCPNNGCLALVLATYLEQHLLECKFREVVCSNCGKSFRHVDYLEHLESQCNKRSVTCSQCKAIINSSDLHRHAILDCCGGKYCVHCEYLVTNSSEHIKVSSMFEHLQRLGLRHQLAQHSVKQLLKSYQETEQKWTSLKCTLKEDFSTSIQPLVEKLQMLERSRKKTVSPQITETLKHLLQRAEDHEKFLNNQKTFEEPRGSLASSDKLGQLETKVDDVQRQLALVKVQLTELEIQLQVALASTFVGAFLWRIPGIRQRRQDAVQGKVESIYSPAFYTGRNGYKMCIQVFLNGEGSGYKSHLSIYIVIMKGEHDPLLKWPFDYKVALILVNQLSNEHIIQNFKPPANSSSFEMPRSDMNISSGCPKFVPLNKINHENSEFIKDDTIFFTDGASCLEDGRQTVACPDLEMTEC